MIKAIIFDWGGVLIDKTDNALMEYCSNVLQVDEKKLSTAFAPYKKDFQRGLITENDLWAKLCNELDLKLPTQNSLWKQAVKSIFNEKPEVYQLAARLKENGYKIGFLSNTEVPTMQHFYEMGYEKYFDVITVSCDEHEAKPDREIYQIIVDKLQVAADEAILIDDLPEFIQGAQVVGMQGILFENPQQLVSELNELGIKTK
jgi:epoxide hydrolase-like predicted phosphatase